MIQRTADASVAPGRVGLRYSSDAEPGYRRVRKGRGFAYLAPDGSVVKDETIKERIRSLVIPPAWTDVWICIDCTGHLQATGRDARNRKQYRYHPDWMAERSRVKYQGLAGFGRMLPAIRSTVAHDLRRRSDMRTQILAAAVTLLDTALIRIGNSEYERENGTYGLTTLRSDHVELSSNGITLDFVGKHHKRLSTKVRDRKVARVLRRCQELPGQLLLQYRSETNGHIGHITSSDVNDYLSEMTGQEHTARTFRTWGASVMLCEQLAERGMPGTKREAERELRSAIKDVAAALGNTPTVCRDCYLHPAIAEMYLDGSFPASSWSRMEDREIDGLSRAERLFMKVLDEAAQSAGAESKVA